MTQTTPRELEGAALFEASCTREGCDRMCKVFPVLLLYTEPRWLRAMWELRALRFCRKCAKKLRVEDLVGDPEWDRFLPRFRRARGGEPIRRELTAIRWQKVRRAYCG